jgi:hypothetical protein
MIRKFIAATAVAAVMAPLSCGATTIAFNLETATFDVTGQAVVSDSLNAVGGYDVESISGSVAGPGGGPITGLIPNPSRPYAYDNGTWIFDNVAYSSAPRLDNPGILFAANGYDYNIYTAGSTYYLSTNNPSGLYNPGEVVLSGSDPAAVPETSTWAMLALGFAALGVWGRRAAPKDRFAPLV